MRFDVLTLFPEMFNTVLGESIIGRAQNNNIINVNLINIRDFSIDKHNRVDDYPYGGGSGMVMQPQPIYDAYSSITKEHDTNPRVIYVSPAGKLLNQELVKELSKENHLIILCGHYEGVDQRVIDEIITDEISIGDYVLTGGEIPAMVLIDSISRLIPGVLGNSESFEYESFSNGLLEYPQYTRPPEWKERKVPDILLSGHHENIKKFQRQQSIFKTIKNRPDLINKADLTDGEKEYINLLLRKEYM